MMKNVDCYTCGSNQKEELIAQEGRDPYLSLVDDRYHELRRSWWTCENCGLIYRSPVLNTEDITTLYHQYEKDIFKNENPDEYFDRITSLPPNISENYQKAVWLKQHLESLSSLDIKNIRILDIGCGGGTLLYTLSEVFGNRNTFGVELNPVYAKLARDKSGAEVTNSNYKSNLWTEKFDLILLTKVLEHVADPLPFLEEIEKGMSVGSFLFIEVPDPVDFKNLPTSHDRFYIPHIYYFGAETLGILAEKANFRVIESRTITATRNRSYLQMLVKRINSES